MKNNKAVILLSGGLDSLAAIGHTVNKKDYDIKLALTFDYGQKSIKKELEASTNIAKFYNIPHKTIKLDWLKEITQTSLVSEKEVPTTNLYTDSSAAEVWVPNRNALFLNIAASFCDSFNYKYILYGANKEEGQTFPDNTENFRRRISNLFKTSTLVKPKVVAPLINYNKNDIVKMAIEEDIPLNLLWSCYLDGDSHCGECESCKHLKDALNANHCDKYVDILFKENEN